MPPKKTAAKNKTAPKKMAPKKTINKKAAPKKAAPKKATKKKAAPKKATKKKAAPKKATKKKAAPKKATKKKAAPKKATKKKTAPKKAITKKAAPKKATKKAPAKVTVSVVHCSGKRRLSKFTDVTVTMKKIESSCITSAEQKVKANDAKGLHNGALHDEHGKVTYLQQVNKGGFYVLVGDPKKLKEKFFAAGSFVAFIDFEGPGHASRVGPKGVERTFRMLKGHLKV
jgi:hypothetical protein